MVGGNCMDNPDSDVSLREKGDMVAKMLDHARESSHDAHSGEGARKLSDEELERAVRYRIVMEIRAEVKKISALTPVDAEDAKIHAFMRQAWMDAENAIRPAPKKK